MTRFLTNAADGSTHPLSVADLAAILGIDMNRLISPTVRAAPRRTGMFGHQRAPVSTAALNSFKSCVGIARGLQGNARLYGNKGAFDVVRPNTAAIIPSQFGGVGKAELRPFVDNIAGRLASSDGTRASWFKGISDVIGGKSPDPNLPVRTYLQRNFPGQMIVEIPGGQDVGSHASIVLNGYPSALPCPTGTRPR